MTKFDQWKMALRNCIDSAWIESIALDMEYNSLFGIREKTGLTSKHYHTIVGELIRRGKRQNRQFLYGI